MDITKDKVVEIAHLARLAIDDKDISKYTEDLSKIMSFVEQMDQADIGDIEPMAHPMDVSQRLRTDEVTESDQHKYFQEIAPRTEAGLYLVPQVIE